MPLSQLVTPARFSTLLSLFDAAAPPPASVGASTTVPQRQAAFLREWLASGSVPSVEFIEWSRGLGNVQPGVSYATILAILVVSLRFEREEIFGSR